MLLFSSSSSSFSMRFTWLFNWLRNNCFSLLSFKSKPRLISCSSWAILADCPGLSMASSFNVASCSKISGKESLKKSRLKTLALVISVFESYSRQTSNSAWFNNIAKQNMNSKTKDMGTKTRISPLRDSFRSTFSHCLNWLYSVLGVWKFMDFFLAILDRVFPNPWAQ